MPLLCECSIFFVETINIVGSKITFIWGFCPSASRVRKVNFFLHKNTPFFEDEIYCYNKIVTLIKIIVNIIKMKSALIVEKNFHGLCCRNI